MIKFMRSAVVVVACLFAGVGAWGAKVTVSPTPTYASELFGAGHSSPEYPADIDPEMDGNQDGTPVVTLFFPANVVAVVDDPATPDNEFVARVNHDGASIITFELIGAVFDGNVSDLMFDTNADETDTGEAVAAPGTVASIMSGGGKGDSNVVIKIEEASTEATTRPISTDAPHTITFTMPRLANLALAGANAADANRNNDEMSVKLRATARLVSGEFTGHPTNGDRLTGSLANGYTEKVVLARDSLTVAISGSGNTKTVAIDDDADKGLMAFKSVKEKNKDGYVELATVTIRTRQEASAAKSATPRMLVGKVQGTAGTDDAGDADIYNPPMLAVDAGYYRLFDLDGDEIDEGLRGAFSVSAAGTRGLFNDDDMLFVDYDKNGKVGAGEAIAIDGDMATGGSLSIDSGLSDSFDRGGTGMFKVYYMPGGKMDINHGAMINLTASVDYSDPSAIDETDAKSSTTLNFDGVGNPVKAYAIPHSTNGTGDKGNVRVRCEQPAPRADACRIFLECWDDMGNRGFGEAPMIAGHSLARWDGAAIEGVTGMEPTSRHSCRVLSRGMVTVQQLTRDGNSGTLVNNTYVGGGM